MAIRLGMSALGEAVLICVAAATCAVGTELRFFQAFGTVTMLPGPAVYAERTYTWHVRDPEYPEWGGDYDSEFIGDPCLMHGGCYMGTIIVQPPRVTLPPGSIITDAADPQLGGWVGLGDFGSPPYAVLRGDDYPAGYGGTEGYRALRLFVPVAPEMLRAASSLDGQLPPLIFDLTYDGPFSGPSAREMSDALGDWVRSNPPDGSQLSFPTGFLWTPDPGAYHVSLDFAYEVASVPEPSTALLFFLGAAALVLNRARGTP